jgi:hypothetical protein
MRDSNVANAAKESTQGEFSHGLFVFRSGETRVFRFSKFFNEINAETCFETRKSACFGLVVFSYARNTMFRLVSTFSHASNACIDQINPTRKHEAKPAHQPARALKGTEIKPSRASPAPPQKE